MKRLLIVLFLITTAFLFFSFLSKTDYTRDGWVQVFYDKNLTNYFIILKDVASYMKNAGYHVSTSPFDPYQINSYLIANPEALFITGMKVKSDLFRLKVIPYFSAYAAVTSRNNGRKSITEEEFDELFKKEVIYDVNRLKKIVQGEIPIGIIPLQNLNLYLKPLKVDGIFPSLYNVKSGKYKKASRAFIYSKDNIIFDMKKNPSLIDNLGLWIDKSFSFIAGGDIMLDRGTRSYIDRFGVEYPFLKIREVIEEHDIAFANLESPISDRGKKFFPDKGIYFRADPSSVRGLKLSGFDVFSLANNHSLDWGVDAITDTMELLKKNGLQYSGVGPNQKGALRPAIFYMKGTSIAFISFNDVYPFKVQEYKKSMETLNLNYGILKNEIESLKDDYDILIVYVHSGEEYRLVPEPEKVNKMRKLIEMGADIVLGGHPHVIQGIEIYKDGLIAYSLGNLIFDQGQLTETSLGLLLEVSFFGGKPLYYNPLIVRINNTQAQVTDYYIDDILLKLNSEKESHRYVKN